MIDWSTCRAVECDPDRVGGAWFFPGARVPVAAVFKHLEAAQVVDWFPGVAPEQVRAVLEDAKQSALASA